MKCEDCGVDEKNTKRIIKSKKYGNLCEQCYQRARWSGGVYEKPPYGEVGYDPNGWPICHICGRSYRKLISHVIQQHKISQEEYKMQFGLDLGKGIMCKESTELARKRNKEHYDKVVKENLLVKGEETRFGNTPPPTSKYFSEQTKRRFLENRYIQPPKKKKESEEK
jgi:hypothetical protein